MKKFFMRLALFFTALVIFFLLFNDLPNRISTVIAGYNHVVLLYQLDFPTNNSSSHFLGFNYNVSNSFNKSEVPPVMMNHCSTLSWRPPPFRLVPVQCETAGDTVWCSETGFLMLNSSGNIEAVGFRSTTTTTSVDSSSASASSISESVTLRNVLLAMLLLMMPNGAHNFDVGSDEEGDNSDDDNNDDDDDSSTEGDVLVYTYEEDVNNNNRPRNQQGNFAFLTNVAYTTTWKEMSDSLHEDFILHYNLAGNNIIAGNPRMCCQGYFARYFQYANPCSEIDIDEPLQEFSPDQHCWLNLVRPLINRINLYRVFCNGF